MQLTPDFRPHLLKNDVGWDLQNYIGDEENSEAGIVFRSLQLQVFQEAED